MLPTYNETYTYTSNNGNMQIVLHRYRRKETQEQRKERFYFIKQRLIGLFVVVLGIVAPLIIQDATISIFMIPMGIMFIVTDEKILMIQE